MTKQEFCTLYEKAQRFWQNSMQLADALNTHLLDGGAIITFGDELLNGYIKLVAEMSGIDADTIGWLLFEGGGDCWHPNDETKYTVTTPEELWDFYKQL